MEKKLYKDQKNKKICGVCSGIAKYFNVDPTLVRLCAVGLSLVTAVLTGIVAYAVCAIVIPEEPEIAEV